MMARLMNAILVGGVASATVQGQRMNWFPLTTTGGPTITSGSTLAYDSARRTSVHFGGWSSTVMSDQTWEYDRAWSQRQPANRPAARERAAMCYDSARQRTVLFGGIDASRSILRDTWEWDGNDWLRRTPSSGPPALTGFAMAYDSARSRCVCFGGYGSTGYSSDTWEWDGTNWTRRTPTTSPPGRENHALAFDSTRGKTVLFGGVANTADLDDTWEWDGTTWTRALPAVRPPARRSHAMVYDTARARTVMTSGRFGLGTTPIYDTWVWDGSTWALSSLNAASPGLFSSPAAYDSTRRRTVLIGPSTIASVIWEYGDTTWSYSTFGLGCPGTNGTPTLGLAAGSYPAIGQNLIFDLRNLPIVVRPLAGILGTSNTRLRGSTPLPIDLGFLGMTACQLLVSDDAMMPVPGGSGASQWRMWFPFDPNFLGASAFLQVLVFDPAANSLGATLTNGATVTVGL